MVVVARGCCCILIVRQILKSLDDQKPPSGSFCTHTRCCYSLHVRAAILSSLSLQQIPGTALLDFTHCSKSRQKINSLLGLCTIKPIVLKAVVCVYGLPQWEEEEEEESECLKDAKSGHLLWKFLCHGPAVMTGKQSSQCGGAARQHQTPNSHNKWLSYIYKYIYMGIHTDQ